METLRCIEKRRSVRVFKEGKIPLEDILKIINAGRLAPSAGNLQGWIFIVVQDKEKKKKLAKAAFGQRWVEKANVVIVICSNVDLYRTYYGERGEKLYSIMDASAAAENMILAATDLGYGTCWVSAFDEEKVKEILGISGGYRPLILLLIGIPQYWPKSPPKRKIEAVTRWEDFKTEKPITLMEKKPLR